MYMYMYITTYMYMLYMLSVYYLSPSLYGHIHVGGRGIAREVWLGRSQKPSTLKDLPYGYPDPNNDWTIEEIFWKSTSEFGESVYFQQRYSGYFVPPITSKYTFNIISDDSMEFYLSTDSTRTNLQKIAYIDSYTSKTEWAKFDTQASTPIELIGGKAYYIEGLQTQYVGGWHIGMGVKIHNLSWTSDRALADHEEQTVVLQSTINKEKQVKFTHMYM